MYVKEFYEIQNITKLEKELCRKENCGKIIIFKNARDKFIKGLIFENCISIGNSCVEYDSIDECYCRNETRKTANSKEIIEKMNFIVKFE